MDSPRKVASRFQRYIDEALGLTGWALLHPQLAFTLRRDIWTTPLMAAQDFVLTSVLKYVESLPRVKVLEVRLVDGWIPVATRSDHDLTNRIMWITGMDVAAVREYQGTTPAETRKQVAQADELPNYPCAARAEHFYKLGTPDPQLAKPPAGLPPSVANTRMRGAVKAQR